MNEKVLMSLRIVKDLKEDIEKIATESDISVNSTVNLLLSAIVEDLKSGKRKLISEVVKVSD